MVTINFKDNKKGCKFFVVPRNGQALLGMPDTAALKIININIDSMQATEEECNTNIGDAKEPNIKQDVDNNDNSHTYTNVNTLTSYFLSLPNIKADKRKSSELT